VRIGDKSGIKYYRRNKLNSASPFNLKQYIQDYGPRGTCYATSRMVCKYYADVFCLKFYVACDDMSFHCMMTVCMYIVPAL